MAWALRIQAHVPFKSKAQRRKFAQLLFEGKIKDETYEEWNRSTGRKVLPERIHPKKGASRTATRANKTTAKRKKSPGSQRLDALRRREQVGRVVHGLHPLEPGVVRAEVRAGPIR